jgi:hypothetical protein
MPVSEAQKRANRKWRQTHREQFASYKKVVDKSYYEKNKEAIATRQTRNYHLKKEFFRLSNICIM